VGEKGLIARKSDVMCARMKNWIGCGFETKIEFDINLERLIIREII
jgi:hypothetical protein